MSGFHTEREAALELSPPPPPENLKICIVKLMHDAMVMPPPHPHQKILYETLHVYICVLYLKVNVQEGGKWAGLEIKPLNIHYRLMTIVYMYILCFNLFLVIDLQ